MQNYEEIFNKRGRSYHMAMEKYPHARDLEFLAITQRLVQKPKSIILDIPAGGGYLKRYLSPDVSYLAHDFSGEFDDNHTGIKKCKESRIELQNSSVDEIVSLAALHHVVSRENFYKELYRILKKGGQLVIGDVVSKGKQDKFLNKFVDQWNTMGHDGKFLEMQDLDEIAAVGFSINYEKEKYTWNFSNEGEATDFFRLLFCMDLNPSEKLLIDAISELGIDQSNGFSVNWELGFVSCIK
ncbi:MAG: methyltransferase domain-containing protein [Bacteroidota bacterium]